MRNIAKHCESSPSEPDCRVFRGFNLAHTSVFSLSAAGGERRGEVAVHSHSPIGCLLAIYRSSMFPSHSAIRNLIRHARRPPRCQSFSWSREMNEFWRCQTVLGKAVARKDCPMASGAATGTHLSASLKVNKSSSSSWFVLAFLVKLLSLVLIVSRSPTFLILGSNLSSPSIFDLQFGGPTHTRISKRPGLLIAGSKFSG